MSQSNGVRAIALLVVVALALLATYALGTWTRGGAAMAADSSTSGSSGQPATITMVGQGSATGIPDELSFSIGVQVTRPDVASAMAQANSTMRKVFEVLAARGVKGKDVQTTDVSVDPVYDYSNNSQQITGYQVSEQAQATVRDLSAAGAVIAAATRAAGNAAQVNGITLNIADPAALQADARRSAVDSATAKAKQYAAAAGVSLGRVLSIKEISTPEVTPMPMASYAAGAAKSASVPVRAGSQQVTAQVQIVWELG